MEDWRFVERSAEIWGNLSGMLAELLLALVVEVDCEFVCELCIVLAGHILSLTLIGRKIYFFLSA